MPDWLDRTRTQMNISWRDMNRIGVFETSPHFYNDFLNAYAVYHNKRMLGHRFVNKLKQRLSARFERFKDALITVLSYGTTPHLMYLPKDSLPRRMN